MMSLSGSQIDTQVSTTLNGICAYFTMFPLTFPYAILREHAKPGDIVLDPFCGRGTTNYASRLLGMPSIGIDSHPLAVALTQAKLAFTTPIAIVNAARRILDQVPVAADVPTSEFWQSAFHPEVLSQICRLRIGLRQDCRSAARKALRAVLLGALHGPLTKTVPSYFSNQMPRTYAPKPAYAVKYWHSHNLTAPSVDVLRLIQTRAERYYGSVTKGTQGWVIEGDSRTATPFSKITNPVQWIITSPPYYGMRTYLPDQWLRLWFLGGPPTVDYSNRDQLRHTSPDYFAGELTQVWHQLAAVSAPQAQLVVRFGGINDRRADPVSIIKESFVASGWQIKETHPAGSASSGRRQALHFSSTPAKAIEEIDVWAIRST